MIMTDGNQYAIDKYLNEQEEYDARQEPCSTCDEMDCDCSEEYVTERGEYLRGLRDDWT